MPQNSVHQVLETRDGFLWIATEGGLARFDGADFRLFNQHDVPALTTDDTCCVAQSTDGAVWVGTADGLLRQQAGRWTRISVQQGLPSPSVLAVTALVGGRVAVLTVAGLVAVDAQGRAQALAGSAGAQATAIAAGPDGSLWIASQNIIFHSQGARLQRVAATAPGEAVLGLQATPAGDLWWWTSTTVTRLAQGRQHSWRAGAALPDSRIDSVFIDREGRAWIGGNRGLAMIPAGSDVAAPVDPIGHTPVLSVDEDREGDLWIGTENSGVSLLRPEQFGQVAGLEDQVITSIVQGTDGAVWVGTRDDGLWRVRGGRLDRPSRAGDLASQVVLALAPGLHGDVWVGTPDGLNHLDARGVTTYTSGDGLPDDFIRSLLVNPDGSLWVGTRRGLALWSPGHVQVWTSRDGLAGDLVGALQHGDAGDLWVATLGGVSRLYAGRLATYASAQGVPGRIPTALAITPDAVVWVGTRDGGLAYFRDGRFVRCRAEGLPDSIDSLLVDDRGFLWMGTRRGLIRVPWVGLERCGGSAACHSVVDQFGVLDGMPSEEASTIGHPSAWRMQDGELWFATRKGVATVDPAELRPVPAGVPVAIESLAVDGSEMSAPGQPQGAGGVRIGPGHSSFTFHYAGLSYRATSHVRYRYRLAGFDRHWTFAGDRRTAYYTNLPPRRYMFQVEASRSLGQWTGPGAELPFVVLPPFYRRWWFYLVAVLCLGAGVYLWHTLRVRRLEASFGAVLGERTRIAREIHDTLAQDFVGVSLQLEVAAQLLASRDVDAARGQLDATRQLVRQGLQDARESIWELRATAAQGTLPARLGRLGDRSTASLAVRVTITGAYRLLSPKMEAELLRIAQEAVTNVQRHAQASAAWVALNYAASAVVLRIEDDGKGFAPGAVAADHYGLQGMRERAAALGAELSVESQAGRGTRIRVTAPTG